MGNPAEQDQHPPQPSLSLRGITKSFHSSTHVTVLEKLDLDLYGGETTLLLGANGSGKSTLLKICAGLLSPDEGEVLFNPSGEQSQNAPATDVKRVSHFGHESYLYSNLTVAENLALYASLSPTSHKPSINDLLAKWCLLDLASRQVRELSRGQCARVSLARAFMHPTKFLLLDEPTNALDLDSIRTVLTALSDLKSKHPSTTFLIASHDISNLKSCVDRAIVLEQGKVAFDSTNVESSGIEKAIDYYRKDNR